MKIIVTGGCGFIGSNLVQGLLEEGHEIFVLDNLINSNANKINRILKEVKFIEFDIGNIKKNLSDVIPDVDFIFHLAAQVSVNNSFKNPVLDAQTNILGSINILKTAVEKNVSKIVLFSSAATYGEPKYLPINESHPQNPKSPYGLSKLVSEKYAEFYQENFPINVTILRPFNVFGPMQDPNSPYSGVISIFLKNAFEDKDLIIFGDGEQTRDFIYVRDVVDLCLSLLKGNKGNNKIFNVATGIKTSINKLATKIVELTKSNSNIRYEKKREGDIFESYSDMSYIEKELDFKPNYTLENGLRKLIEFQRKVHKG